MNDNPQDTETSAPAEQAPEPVMRAVLAIPTYDNNGGWAGRILGDAPGPAATVRVLHEILGKRHKGRNRVRDAVSELIHDHPAGWEHLGDPSNTTGGTRRRGEIPLGVCRCHHPDGTAREGLARAQRDALASAEWRGHAHFARDPEADGAPRLITKSHALDPGVAHVFLVNGDCIEIHARDNSADRNFNKVAEVRGFSTAARVKATGPIDWDALGPQIDAASAELRARPRTDWDRVGAARALARAAKELERVPAHADLVLYLLGKEAGTSRRAAEAALAEAGDVHSADLPALLLRAPRSEQLRLLRDAAHATDPAEHHAP